MTPAKSTLERKIDRLGILLYSMGAAIIIIFAILVFGVARDQQNTQQIHQALCAEKNGYAQQVASTKKYLKQHPDGAPALHLSAGYLRQQIKKEQKQLKAFESVSCS